MPHLLPISLLAFLFDSYLLFTAKSFCMRKYLARTMHFFQIAGFCCLLVILMAVYVDFLQSTIGFYLIIMFVCISVATPLSLIILDQHFVLWIIDFVSQHSYRVSIKPDTPINVYTRFGLNTAKSKFSLVSPVAD